MNTFEQLTDEACKDGIEVFDAKFNSNRIKGLYCNGNIALNKNVLESTVEKVCTLSEELGHHYTSYGDIIDQSASQAKKQERQARLWGYNKIIGLQGIINCFEAGRRSVTDAAEFLGVTEEFFQNCIDCYTEKYGTGIQVGNYYVMFIPYLGVMKMI